MAEMKTLNGYEVVDEKARERLDTLVIPTKTSQLENDSQFTNKQYVDTAIETAKPDLTGYYTQAQTDAAIQTAIGNIDIPTVPTNVSAFTNDAQYTNKTYVDNAVESVDVSAQLTEYAKKTELPTKVSQLQNDAGYLTEHQSLTGYATETYVDNKVAEIDVTTYATKQEVTAVENKIPSLDGYATKQELTAVENKIPSLTGYATEAYVDGKIAEIPGTDLSNYYNKEQTNSAISTAIAGITIPTKVSELENDSNFVTETALETKGYVTADDVSTAVSNARDNFYIDASGFTTFFQNVPAPQAVIALVTYFNEHGHACVYLRDTQDAQYYPALFANPSTDYYLLMKSGTNWNSISSGDEIKWDTISIEKTSSGTWVWQSRNTGAVTLARKSDIPATDTFVTNETLEQKGYVTETQLNNKGYLTAIPEEYVTETELDNKGYLTAVPAEYVTETELNNKGYLTAVPDTYALKTDIPDVSSFTTMAAVEAKGYLTEQSLNGYATETYVTNAINAIEIPQAKTWHSYNTVAVPDEVKTKDVYHIKFSLRWTNPEFPSTDPDGSAYFTETFDTFSAGAGGGFPISISSDHISDRYYGYSAYLKKTIAWWWHNNQLVVQNMDDSTTLTSKVESVHYWY